MGLPHKDHDQTETPKIIDAEFTVVKDPRREPDAWDLHQKRRFRRRAWTLIALFFAWAILDSTLGITRQIRERWVLPAFGPATP